MCLKVDIHRQRQTHVNIISASICKECITSPTHTGCRQEHTSYSVCKHMTPSTAKPVTNYYDPAMTCVGGRGYALLANTCTYDIHMCLSLSMNINF